MISNVSRLFDEYSGLVSKFFPDFEWSHRTIDTATNEAIVEFSLSNYLLTGTKYEFDNTTSNLIHYTDVRSLFEIISSHRLRLSSVKDLNDPLEGIFALDSITENHRINLLKRRNNFFLMSFCKYKDSKDESSNMWRLYGREGYGVGIVLKLNNKLPNWHHHYVLGQVAYSTTPSDTAIFNTFYNEHDKFCNEHGAMRVPSAILYPMLLNKADFWSDEKEVRLIYRSNKADSALNEEVYDPTVFPTLDLNMKLRHYSSLRIDHRIKKAEIQKALRDKTNPNHFDMFYESEPQFTIEKIVWGYRLNQKEIAQYDTALKAASRETLGYNFKSETSRFAKYFQEQP